MSSTRRALVFASVLGVLAVVSGCHKIPGHGKPVPVVDPVTGDSIPHFIEVQVENHNWSDVVVYLLHGGTRLRLGTAGTARSTEFRFPANYAFANRVSLLVAPIGSRSQFESERFKVHPGQRVFWTIESGLVRSSLMIR
jgi:hypothetical protein